MKMAMDYYKCARPEKKVPGWVQWLGWKAVTLAKSNLGI